MSKGKEIDYLFEDPPIPSQQYALITIVGPGMPQKCDVWGLKVRGVTKTLEESNSLASRLQKIDDNYDIHTVEVGKFVPLVVDPSEIKDTVYANEQLNELNKEYLKQNQKANDAWLQRKNDMVKQAIEEGKEGGRTEPVVTYTSMQTVKQRKAQLEKEMKELDEKYEWYCEQFDKCTPEEKDAAIKEFDTEVAKNVF